MTNRAKSELIYKQIMGIMQLAPDIQEAILWLPAVESGGDVVTEGELRDVVAELDWERQGKRWRGKLASCCAH